MAKTNETTQERNDKAFRDSCNEAAQERNKKNADELAEAIENITKQAREAAKKAAENAERYRKRKLAREVAVSFVAAACAAGLYMAEANGLMHTVLADPMRAIAFVCIGWHLCKAGVLWGRK